MTMSLDLHVRLWLGFRVRHRVRDSVYTIVCTHLSGSNTWHPQRMENNNVSGLFFPSAVAIFVRPRVKCGLRTCGPDLRTGNSVKCCW